MITILCANYPFIYSICYSISNNEDQIEQLSSVCEMFSQYVLSDTNTYCTSLTYNSNNEAKYSFTVHATQVLQQKLDLLLELLVNKEDVQLQCADILQFMLPL